MIALYNEKAFEADFVPIDSTVANFLFTFTAGHVGATSLSIWVIVHLFWTPEKQTARKKTTSQEIIDFLYGLKYLNWMQTSGRAMSTPVKGWSPNQRKVIEEALSSDDYKYHIKFGSTEHLSLLRLGYMYMTADKEYPPLPITSASLAHFLQDPRDPQTTRC